jgi:hypothetical protein
MSDFAGRYVNVKLVEVKLSPDVVRRIFDDYNAGVVDKSAAGPLALAIKDAESKFEGFCRGKYDLNVLRSTVAATGEPHEAIRIVLEVVEAIAAKRFPRAMGRNWMELEASVNKELSDLRAGKTRLDVMGAPEPAADVGGYTSNGDQRDLGEPRDTTFNGNWGSF